MLKLNAQAYRALQAEHKTYFCKEKSSAKNSSGTARIACTRPSPAMCCDCPAASKQIKTKHISTSSWQEEIHDLTAWEFHVQHYRGGPLECSA